MPSKRPQSFWKARYSQMHCMGFDQKAVKQHFVCIAKHVAGHEVNSNGFLKKRFLKKIVKSCEKTVDVARKYAIILNSAIKIPIQLYYAQSTTGGRLGVRLCQM